MKKIRVSLGERSYPVYVGSGALASLGQLIVSHGLKGTACVVTQKEIWTRWGHSVKASLDAQGIPFKLYLPPARARSEQMKASSELLKLTAACAGLDGKGRGVFLVALGGGVVGDLTGFAASIYRRGVPYVQVPTTLTAQVDSAIGGKTAVDLPQGKNLLGTIYQPRFVLADPAVLKSLPQETFCEGLAEVVKYGVIKDAPLLKYLESNRAAILGRADAPLERIILASARIKAAVVSRDEFDKKDVRIVLNFGHTAGHAIESAGGYRGYSHGQAVAIGMMVAVDLSEALGVLKDKALGPRLEALLRGFSLPTRIAPSVRIDAVLKAIGYDKKNVDGTNRFVLVERPGKTRVHPAVPQRLIHDKLQRRSEAPGRKSASGLWSLFGRAKREERRTAPPPAPAQELPQKKCLIGEVEGYFDKAGAAVVRLSKPLRVGERVRFFGRTTDFAIIVDSMQIDRVPIEAAAKGKVIGLKVSSAVRRGDGLYRA